jgi:hypothetical protein
MKKLIVGSLASVLASAGLAVAQSPLPAGPPNHVVTATQPNAPAGTPNFSSPLGSDLVVPLNGTPGGDCCGAPHWHEIVDPTSPWYGGAEYLLLWSKNGPVDFPLVTIGSTADKVGGALGQPNTVVLFPAGDPLDFGATSGARMVLGYWFDRQGSFGLEGVGMVMEQRANTSRFTSNGSGAPLLGQPFLNTGAGINAKAGLSDFNDSAMPLVAVGGVDVVARSQLYGFEVNAVTNLLRDDSWNVDVFGGFRWLGLDESLIITNASVAAPGFVSFFENTAFPPPAVTSSLDNFTTHNHFYGANIGGRLDYKTNNWLFGVALRVGLGDVREEVDVKGFSSLFVGPVGPVSTVPTGFLAGPNNSGRFTEDTFGVVPQVDLKVGYQFNSHLSAYVGYMFLYWSDVVRPGSQIDPNVNPNKVPTFVDLGQPGGTQNPLPQFSHSEYWIQGVSFGVEVKF